MLLNPQNLSPYQLSVLSNDVLFDALRDEYLTIIDPEGYYSDEGMGSAFVRYKHYQPSNINKDFSQPVIKRYVYDVDKHGSSINKRSDFDARAFVISFYHNLLMIGSC